MNGDAGAAESSAGSARPRRFSIAVHAALVAGATALSFFAGHWRLAPALVSWILAWGGALGLLARLDRGKMLPARRDSRTRWLGVLALLAVAVALRVVDLEWLPGRLHNDEMTCGLEARRFLEPNPPAPFGLGGFDCPTLEFFVASLGMRVAGDTLLGLRLTSVALGVLGLLGTYVLFRTVSTPNVALVTLALAVPFHWHVHLSRTGLHYVHAATAAIWTLALAARAVERRSLLLAGAAGVVLGSGLQGYSAAHIVPFVLVAALAARWVFERELRKSLVQTAAVSLVLAVIRCAPLVQNYLQEPTKFNRRGRDVFVFGTIVHDHVAGALEGEWSVAGILRYQLLSTARFFTVRGDTSLQYGFEGPMLDRAIQIPFFLGILLAIIRFRRPDASLALIWTGATLLAGAVLTIDPPFSPRLSGIATTLCFFPALVLVEGATWLRGRNRDLGAIAIAVVGAIVLVSGILNVRRYFLTYASDCPPEPRDVIALWRVRRPVCAPSRVCWPRPSSGGTRATSSWHPERSDWSSGIIPRMPHSSRCGRQRARCSWLRRSTPRRPSRRPVPSLACVPARSGPRTARLWSSGWSGRKPAARRVTVRLHPIARSPLRDATAPLPDSDSREEASVRRRPGCAPIFVRQLGRV